MDDAPPPSEPEPPTASDAVPPALATAARAVADSLGADIFAYVGDISARGVERFRSVIPETPVRGAPAVLVLATLGGDADAAYRMARCLQTIYGSFTIFVPRSCMSAGTLVAVGASKIIMGDGGQLGPLDVQLRTPDDLFEQTSGLAIEAALDFLDERALKMFRQVLEGIAREFGSTISTKTMIQLAVDLVKGLLGPIYSHLDPVKIGENFREVRVAEHYCTRLDIDAKNLNSVKSIDILVSSFFSHTTVIDRRDAGQVFRRVETPSAPMVLLAEELENFLPEWPYSPFVAQFSPGVRQPAEDHR